MLHKFALICKVLLLAVYMFVFPLETFMDFCEKGINLLNRFTFLLTFIFVTEVHFSYFFIYLNEIICKKKKKSKACTPQLVVFFMQNKGKKPVSFYFSWTF